MLLVPLLAVLGLRIYENHLVRQTERQLIAQSIAVGEMWRELWLIERGIDPQFGSPLPSAGQGNGAVYPD